jgi:hypothetical protein
MYPGRFATIHIVSPRSGEGPPLSVHPAQGFIHRVRCVLRTASAELVVLNESKSVITACSSPVTRPWARRAQGQPRHLRHAGKQARLGTGSIDTILAGGEPQETVVKLRRTTPTRPTHPNALSQVSTEELLLELRRRIIAPRDRRQDTWDDWDGGLDPHGDWPEQG